MLNRTLTFLRQNNLYNSMAKEVLGSNLPHLALVMNRYELADQALIQFSNTANVFGLSQLMAKLYDAVFARLPGKNPTTAVWSHLAKTAWCHGQIISFMLSFPALRNAIMTRFTHTTRFVDMVGLNGKVEEPPDVVEAAVRSNLHTFLRFYATGMALTTMATAALMALAKQGRAVPQAVNAFYRVFGLPQGDYRQMKDAAAIVFWAYPVYLGWWIHSRDKSETIETAVKAGGFALAFSLLPRQLEKLSRTWLKGQPHAANKAFLLQIVSACIFYTSLPTIANLLFRRKRAEKLGLLKTPVVNAAENSIRPSQGAPLTSGQLTGEAGVPQADLLRPDALQTPMPKMAPGNTTTPLANDLRPNNMAFKTLVNGLPGQLSKNAILNPSSAFNGFA